MLVSSEQRVQSALLVQTGSAPPVLSRHFGLVAGVSGLAVKPGNLHGSCAVFVVVPVVTWLKRIARPAPDTFESVVGGQSADVPPKSSLTPCTVHGWLFLVPPL